MNPLDNFHLFSPEVITKDFLEHVYNVRITQKIDRDSIDFFPFSGQISSFIGDYLWQLHNLRMYELSKKEFRTYTTKIFSLLYGVYTPPFYYTPSIDDRLGDDYIHDYKQSRLDYKKILCQLENLVIPLNLIEDTFYKEVYGKYDFITLCGVRPLYITLVMRGLLDKDKPYIKQYKTMRLCFDGPQTYARY